MAGRTQRSGHIPQAESRICHFVGNDILQRRSPHYATFAEYASSDSWKGNTFRAYRTLDLRVPTISWSDSKDYAVFVQKIAEATSVPPTPKRESKMTDASVATVSTPTSAKSDAPARMPGVDTKAISPSTKNDGGAIASSLSPSVSSPSGAEPPPSPHVLSPETRDIYKRGEEEAKRKNWANAIEAFSSAVKADPQYPDAWRELGRARCTFEIMWMWKSPSGNIWRWRPTIT